MNKAEASKFFRLVDKTGSGFNGERVIARLQLNAFVLKHGKDVCQDIYDRAKARRAEKSKAKKK